MKKKIIKFQIVGAFFTKIDRKFIFFWEFTDLLIDFQFFLTEFQPYKI